MTTIAISTDSIVADAHFHALRDYIVASTGLDYYADRPQTLADHIGDRITERGLSGCRAYLELLHDGDAGETELDQIIERLTIGETYFFRHRELFDAIRDVALPEILERNRATQRIRVWSAGCSTGAEAYSLSILLRRKLPTAIKGWNISIVGTDINRPFLAQATAGQFEEWAFRGTTPEFRRECFQENTRATKSWQIAPQFQVGVTFQYHNLVRHPFPSLVHNLLGFDLILCRNVLIYFAPDVAQRIISQLAQCLAPGGWLAVGHAENGAHFQTWFETVNLCGATLHRKADSPASRPAIPVAPRPNSTVRSAAQTDATGRPRTVERRLAAPARSLRTSSTSPEIEQVRRLADQGKVDAALALCQTLISGETLNAVPFFYQGLLLDQVAGHDAALDALNRAIYLDHEFVLAHYYLGLVQRKLADVRGATKSFRNVLRLLQGHAQTSYLPDAEGMTVADLNELTRMHITALQAS